MKKIIAYLVVFSLLLSGVAAAEAAVTEDKTLYQRIITLLEEGDETLYYSGISLGIGMDDGAEPEGLVTVDIDTSVGKILLTHEEDYDIWEHVTASDCANTLAALCARWATLTDGMADELCVKFWINTRTEENCITISSLEEAVALLQSLYEQQDDG